MEVWRVNKTKNFTVMSNIHIRDKNLSLKAKGLMSILLSLPDDWQLSIKGLASICAEKSTTVKNVLKELQNNGYVKVTKLFPGETKSGRIEYIYDVYESPLTGSEPTEKQSAKDVAPKETVPEIAAPPPKQTATAKEEPDTEFEAFWAAYPKKVAKKDALKAWKKINPNQELIDIIKSALERHKKSAQWTKDNGQYIPYPSTWLNGRRWEDDVTDSILRGGTDNGAGSTNPNRGYATNPANFHGSTGFRG